MWELARQAAPTTERLVARKPEISTALDVGGCKIRAEAWRTLKQMPLGNWNRSVFLLAMVFLVLKMSLNMEWPYQYMTHYYVNNS